MFHTLTSIIETPPELWGWYGIDLNDHVPVDVGYGAWDAVDRCRVDFALSEGTQGVGWGYCSPEYPLMSIEYNSSHFRKLQKNHVVPGLYFLDLMPISHRLHTCCITEPQGCLIRRMV